MKAASKATTAAAATRTRTASARRGAGGVGGLMPGDLPGIGCGARSAVWRSVSSAAILIAYARDHRILRRLKLRTPGRRSGGRDPERLSARRGQDDRVVGRRVRG